MNPRMERVSCMYFVHVSSGFKYMLFSCINIDLNRKVDFLKNISIVSNSVQDIIEIPIFEIREKKNVDL